MLPRRVRCIFLLRDGGFALARTGHQNGDARAPVPCICRPKGTNALGPRVSSATASTRRRVGIEREGLLATELFRNAGLLELGRAGLLPLAGFLDHLRRC